MDTFAFKRDNVKLKQISSYKKQKTSNTSELTQRENDEDANDSDNDNAAGEENESKQEDKYQGKYEDFFIERIITHRVYRGKTTSKLDSVVICTYTLIRIITIQ